MTVRAGIRRHSALGFTNPSQFGPRKKGGAVASTSGRSQRRRDPPSHQRAPARRWHSAQPSLRLVPLAALTSGHRQTLPLAPQPAGNPWQNSTVELRVFTRPRSNPAAAARSSVPGPPCSGWIQHRFHGTITRPTPGHGVLERFGLRVVYRTTDALPQLADAHSDKPKQSVKLLWDRKLRLCQTSPSYTCIDSTITVQIGVESGTSEVGRPVAVDPNCFANFWAPAPLGLVALQLASLR